MDTTTIAETTTERMIRSFMEGAESGMIEVRGYGLTASEREDAERESRPLRRTGKDGGLMAAIYAVSIMLVYVGLVLIVCALVVDRMRARGLVGGPPAVERS